VSPGFGTFILFLRETCTGFMTFFFQFPPFPETFNPVPLVGKFHPPFCPLWRMGGGGGGGGFGLGFVWLGVSFPYLRNLPDVRRGFRHAASTRLRASFSEGFLFLSPFINPQPFRHPSAISASKTLGWLITVSAKGPGISGPSLHF